LEAPSASGKPDEDRTVKGKPLFVRAQWDEEAAVWVATSDDVPGVATEEATMEGLMAKLEQIIPELLELNYLRTK
jgi:predicted RNase H-like HicB family nuclease